MPNMDWTPEEEAAFELYAWQEKFPEFSDALEKADRRFEASRKAILKALGERGRKP